MITPRFSILPQKRHRLLKNRHGTEIYNNWSGAAIYSATNIVMNTIEATWTIPNTFPLVAATDGIWYSASAWIGLDGDGNSTDIIQAGCDSDLMIANGVISRQTTPWWEWYPGDTVGINNFAVALGDTVNCLIGMSSVTGATIYFHNLTSGTAETFAAALPPGVKLTGNCAEWIVEALELGSTSPMLARYGGIFFNECNCGNNAGIVQSLSDASVISMNDPSGKIISTGEVKLPNLLCVAYTG